MWCILFIAIVSTQPSYFYFANTYFTMPSKIFILNQSCAYVKYNNNSQIIFLNQYILNKHHNQIHQLYSQDYHNYHQSKYPNDPKLLSSIFQQLKNNSIASHRQKITTFCQKHELQDQNHTQQMLFLTLNSLCKVNGAYGDTYTGLCWHGQIDIRYSPLIIDWLFDYDVSLGLWLFDNLFTYLQQKLFYSSEAFVEVPQHIEVARRCLRHPHLIRKVASVLNGFINQMLLSDLSTIEKEENYREQKVLHPAIRRMLSLTWKATSIKAALSSITAESFLNDAYGYSDTEQPDMSLSKISWLIKAVQEMAVVGGVSQQLNSLYTVLVNYLNDGHLKSVKIMRGLRVYALQYAYEHFLPYIYRVSKAFPTEAFANLTSPYGLLSLKEEKFSNEMYHFRGNINLYFNYKILNGISTITQDKQQLSLVKEMIGRFTKLLESNKEIYWEWTKKGEPREIRNSLALIYCMIRSNKMH